MNRKFIVISIVVVLITVFGYGFTVSEATLNNNDPLISLSYLNMIIDKLILTLDSTNQTQDSVISTNTTSITTHATELAKVETDIKSLSTSIESVSTAVTNPLEVVEVFSTDELLSKSGKSITTTGPNKIFVGGKIIADAGTEIILRYNLGSTTAITSESGGLSDVTGGADIQSGQNIPENHLLLIPRSDGRGIYISNYAIFMIRGTYKVE